MFHKSAKKCCKILNGSRYIWAQKQHRKMSKNSWIWTRSVKIYAPIKTPWPMWDPLQKSLILLIPLVLIPLVLFILLIPLISFTPHTTCTSYTPHTPCTSDTSHIPHTSHTSYTLKPLVSLIPFIPLGPFVLFVPLIHNTPLIPLVPFVPLIPHVPSISVTLIAYCKMMSHSPHPISNSQFHPITIL